MKLIITEKQYNDLRRHLNESEEEYYKISPQDFIKEIILFAFQRGTPSPLRKPSAPIIYNQPP